MEETFQTLKGVIDERYFQADYPCSCGDSFKSQQDFFRRTTPTERLVVYEPEFALVITRNHQCNPKTNTTKTLYLDDKDLRKLESLVQTITQQARAQGITEGKVAENIIRDYSNWIIQQS